MQRNYGSELSEMRTALRGQEHGLQLDDSDLDLTLFSPDTDGALTGEENELAPKQLQLFDSNDFLASDMQKLGELMAASMAPAVKNFRDTMYPALRKVALAMQKEFHDDE